MKKVRTLVNDIYDVLEKKKAATGVDVDAVVDAFGESMKAMLREVITEREDSRTLRMSNIGRADRFLWFTHKGVVKEKFLPHTLMKFLYGHATEELILALVALAGHEVADQQREVEVNGIRGKMDCTIDGVLIDVKTASPYGFKKFKEGTVRDGDTFGYVAQLKGYAAGLGHTKGGWLAIDKTNGHLAVHMENFEYDASIHDRIDEIKEIVESPEMPEQCFGLVPDGKSGNTKLATGCSYCVFKKECFPNLRAFKYSTGPRYLVSVINYPKVPELYDFN